MPSESEHPEPSSESDLKNEQTKSVQRDAKFFGVEVSENCDVDGELESKFWEHLTNVLEEFWESWERAPSEPILDEFVTKAVGQLFNEFRIPALVELIKIDMEARASGKANQRTISDYLQDWPELSRDDKLPPDLVYEQHRLSRENSTTRSLGEMQAADPLDKMNALVKLIDPSCTQTTSLLAHSRVHQFEPGQRIDDFDLLSRLGKGAFASVFLARQNSMQRLVALKISADQGVEGQTLAQLDHPHIVRVYDQRVVHDSGSGSSMLKAPVRLMYMQYIPGTSLAKLLERMERTGGASRDSAGFLKALNTGMDDTGEALPVLSDNRTWIQNATWSQIVSAIGSQLASALEYAHRQGVLHRDIKPANVLIDAHGFPKLVDFNISHSAKISGTTAASYFGGSLAYMSPEQLEAANPESAREPDSLDSAADLYSLGVMLFELLVKRRPFSNRTKRIKVQAEEENDKEKPTANLAECVPENRVGFLQKMTLARQQGLDRTEQTQLRSENPLIASAIIRCLEPEPAARFQNAQSLARQLKWGADEEVSAYLAQSDKGWTKHLADWPFAFITAAAFSIAVFATWFVVNYLGNTVVAEVDLDLYSWTRRVINFTVFPAVTVFAWFLIRPVIRALMCTGSAELSRVSNDELKSAIRRNLNLGYCLAIVFAAAWAISGVIYPLLLGYYGALVTSGTWFDFVMSHGLAGLLTASYVFCTITAFSLIAWHPRLMMKALQREVDIDVAEEARATLKLQGLFQFLAVATPLAAIAILVRFRDADSTFAIGVLSTAAFVGLGVLAWAMRNIQNSINIILRMKD